MIVPGEFETTEHPSMAAKNRHTMTVAPFFATAHGSTKNMNANDVLIYTGRRPSISLIGAQIILPAAIPKR